MLPMNSLGSAMLAISLLTLPLGAAEDPASDTRPTAANAAPISEIEQLKRMLVDQQRQIDELRRALQARDPQTQSATVAAPEPARLPHGGVGEVASTTAIVPSASAVGPLPALLPAAMMQDRKPEDQSSPLSFRIGDAYITPVGFMDFTSITRSTNTGNGIGTNFGSVPYANVQAGSLTESRLSPQNSRIGLRVDAMVKGSKVLGYLETDFLGQIGNPPNGGLAVTSNPYPLRMRLYWVDVRKDKFEFLAGQSWSLLTPNRRGMSALPGDLFYSQNIDVNYQLGLIWGRIPGIRFLYHPTEKVTFGVGFENSEPYFGGANGGGAATPPAALAGLLGTQINNGGSVITAPAVHPDIIAKLAFDPSSKFHIELAGVEITNKISNPASTPAFQTHTKAGVGGSLNLNFDVAKNIRILTNNFWSDGGGRYIFGQAPDFILRSDGAISPVHSASTVTGFEATAGKTLFYGYYGGVYINRNTALDANGKSLIGYGFSGSGNGQNRAIQEITFGTNTTIWKDAKYGALNLMFQYSYLQRNPWFVATGQPSDAHVHMGFFNLRYTLPGSAPTLGK
jgi:hypothetical protein